MDEKETKMLLTISGLSDKQMLFLIKEAPREGTLIVLSNEQITQIYGKNLGYLKKRLGDNVRSSINVPKEKHSSIMEYLTKGRF